ncbi:hypothetical protein [Actinocrispum sp. NPDC049592]|uniref:hypothetical protein n=1 Tax=Actinocrispum sp. NPDC049592 TaxID=3154835 RepID=UPI0034213567
MRERTDLWTDPEAPMPIVQVHTGNTVFPLEQLPVQFFRHRRLTSATQEQEYASRSARMSTCMGRGR